MEQLLLTTLPGFEEVVEDELRVDFGLEAALLAPGCVAARLPAGGDLPATVRALNRRCRCAGRVGVVLLDEEAADLAAIEELTASLGDPVEHAGLVGGDRSFAVRARRSGEHAFRSPDVERTVGTGINRAIRRRAGSSGRVDLDDPDVLIRADLQGERLFLWLDTTGYRALHVRAYRRHAHMASMRPTVANLLLRLSRWDGRPLVDPFCGSATILIEGLLSARGMPPALHRGCGWAWQRIDWLAAGDRESEPLPPALAADRPWPVALGVERYASHLQRAWENAALAGVTDGLRLHEGFAQEVDAIASELGLDVAGGVVVTNPPFGRRVGSVRMLDRLYGDACRAWARAGIHTVATVTERADPMRSGLQEAGYRIRRELPVVYGSSPVTVFLAARE